MTFFKYIDIQVFLIAMTFGFVMAYMYDPLPKIVFKYPTPYNLESVYIDNVGTCYKYEMNQVACPADGRYVKPMPLV
jgi:hypothetical protein